MKNAAPLFEVSDPLELVALWRLVAEAKFHENPEDTDIWGSPYVRQLSQRISDGLLRSYQESGNESRVHLHKEWIASLPSNVVLPVVRARLKSDAMQPHWLAMTAQDKVEYVKACVAPFEPDNEFVVSLISEAEG